MVTVDNIMLKPKTKKGPPSIEAQQTLSRRSLIDWMGKAAVLALGADLAAACSAMDERTGWGSDSSSDICYDNESFEFGPGPEVHDVFDNWGERTVDPQTLTSIVANWQLRVVGMVENPMVFTFEQLMALPRQDQVTDFHCVEGWTIPEVPWNGVHLSTIADIVKPTFAASHITFHTLGDIYNENIPIDVAMEEKTLLAYGIDCSTIPLRHGFPLRLVVPRKWAYKSAKYVYQIRFTDGPEEGYWVKLNYPYDADVPESKLREGFY